MLVGRLQLLVLGLEIAQLALVLPALLLERLLRGLGGLGGCLIPDNLRANVFLFDCSIEELKNGWLYQEGQLRKQCREGQIDKWSRRTTELWTGPMLVKCRERVKTFFQKCDQR